MLVGFCLSVLFLLLLCTICVVSTVYVSRAAVAVLVTILVLCLNNLILFDLIGGPTVQIKNYFSE